MDSNIDRDGCTDKRLSHTDSPLTMNMRSLTFDDVNSFVKLREIDLALAPARAPYGIALHAEFNGYADFFSILAADIEYIDYIEGVTIAELKRIPSFSEATSMAPKWKWLKGAVSAPALIIRGADSSSWEDAGDGQLFVIVANRLEFEKGADWESVIARLSSR